jgi:hypothetical protein
VTEIGVGGANSDNQLTVRHWPGLGQGLMPGRVYADNPTHQHSGVSLGLQEMADRPCDLGWRKGRRSHLIEEGLESVMVLRINDHHLDRRSGQRARRLQAAEPRTDDDHARPRRRLASIPGASH